MTERGSRRRGKVEPPRRVLNLSSYVPALVAWIANKLSNDGSKTYRRWYDLGITDWRVLAYLGVHENGSAAKICRLIGLDKAATSRSIVTLKARGLLATVQLKGRTVELSITPEGREQYESMLALAFAREEALLTGFSDEERATTIALMHRLLANLERVSRIAPPT